MFTGMIPKKLIKSKVFVSNVGRNFMTIHAILNGESFARINAPTLPMKNLRQGFVPIAKNLLRLIHLGLIFAAPWSVGQQDQRRLIGPCPKKFFASVVNAGKSFIANFQRLKVVVANFALVNAELILNDCLTKQIRAFMVQGFGCRLGSAFSNGTIILAKSADLEENIFMSIIRNIREMVERKTTKISLPYAPIATG